jgi:hypothetical protein
MASFAEQLRNKSAEVRSNQNGTTNFSEKKKADITTFFNYMKNDAENKMGVRAEKGYNSANILEYTYAEYFFIDENNEVVRTPKYSKPTTENGKAYRIFEAIRTSEFKDLLTEYEKELGEGMEIAMWWPGGNINVIEAIWGPTKYHRRTKTINKGTSENIEVEPEITPSASNTMADTSSDKVTYSSIAKK